MELIIGDKVWSSWSMRPWLAIKHAGAPFTETLVRLRRAGADETARAAAAAGSPSGMVPVLKDGALTVWDSLAICEYLAETFPAAALWPADPLARASGRSAAAEMHSGFHSLRGECPMDLALHACADVSEATARDLRRIVELWTGLLKRFGGPFLLGPAWSIADTFFTPVASRVGSYGLRLGDHGDIGPAAEYANRLLRDPAFLAWEADALADAGRSET